MLKNNLKPNCITLKGNNAITYVSMYSYFWQNYEEMKFEIKGLSEYCDIITTNLHFLRMTSSALPLAKFFHNLQPP